MFLELLVVRYISAQNSQRAIGKELARRTFVHLRECVRVFSKWLDHPATTEDLSPETINAFLAALIADGRSPWTAKNRHTGLRVLWRYAIREGLAADRCREMRSVHCPELDIDGYSTDDARALHSVATGLKGKMRRTNIPRSIWWGSLLPAKWDFGLRAGDMLTFRPKHFDPLRGALWVRESKTGKTGWRILRQSTREAIEECLSLSPDRDLIWPGLNANSFFRAFKKIAIAAGLPGTSKWLRRGSSSMVDQENPGSGWRFLKHSSPSVWEKHYRVGRIVEPNPLRPPSMQPPHFGEAG